MFWKPRCPSAPTFVGKRHGGSPRNKGGRVGCIREEAKGWKGIEKDKQGRRRGSELDEEKDGKGVRRGGG